MIRRNRSSKGNRLGLALLCIAAVLAVGMVPDRAETSPQPCAGLGLAIPAVGALGTGVLGIPAYTAPNTDLDVALGGGTGGLDFNTTLAGDWGKFGYQIDALAVESGGLCLRDLWGTMSISFTHDLIDDRDKTLRTFYGAGVFSSIDSSGPNLQIGINYESRIGRHLAAATRLRYVPGFSTSGPPSELDRLLLHGLRGSAQIQWRATPGFQPFVRIAGGSADPGFIGGAVRDPLALYASGLLGVRARWPADTK